MRFELFFNWKCKASSQYPIINWTIQRIRAFSDLLDTTLIVNWRNRTNEDFYGRSTLFSNPRDAVKGSFRDGACCGSTQAKWIANKRFSLANGGSSPN